MAKRRRNKQNKSWRDKESTHEKARTAIEEDEKRNIAMLAQAAHLDHAAALRQDPCSAHSFDNREHILKNRVSLPFLPLGQ